MADATTEVSRASTPGPSTTPQQPANGPAGTARPGATQGTRRSRRTKADTTGKGSAPVKGRSRNTPRTPMEWAFSLGLVGVIGLGVSLNLAGVFTPDPQESGRVAVATETQRAPALPGVPSATKPHTSSSPGASASPSEASFGPAVLGHPADQATKAAITQALDPILDTFPAEGTGVALLDPSGAVVAAKGGDVPLLPASTIKVATGAALWNVFGPDHRFETTFMTLAPIGPDGIVNGDLYVVGDGDPTMMSELAIDWKVRPPRPTLSTGMIADKLVEAGIKGVTGSIVGVDRIYQGEPTAKGWKPSYLPEQNATRIYALSVDRGLVFVPKGTKGEAASQAGIYHTRQVEGPKAQEGYMMQTSLDTRTDAAAAITQSLLARNVNVAGAPASANAVPANAVKVASVMSLPLRQMVDWIELRSDNHMADMLVRRLDVEVGGDGSFDSAGTTVIDHIEQLGVDTAGMAMFDGSGLSREDRISAEQLASVVVHMGYSDPDWLGSLAVMGETGTTSNRLKNTTAQGRWLGKTGSLDDVVSYCGVIKDRQGELWTIAMVANGKGAIGKANALHDQVLVTLSNVLPPATQIAEPKGV